ncbi:amidase [Streptomyces sp. NPDC058665]|uniref:amidase n=1 Tax=Streptomyces sp. NPDC058665 TaxID=3346586 RepID=UPI00366105B7
MTPADLCFSSVRDQLTALREGRVTSAALVDAYLARIDRLDGTLNAFRLVFADAARRAAGEADARRAAGEDAPLLGVPIAVKEETDLAGLPTTNGTDGVTTVAGKDAEIVSRLRRAGAIILGRTRAPELCLWPFTQTYFAGPTRNPWSLEHSPGGSSGGAAAAVAGGLVSAALGSDGGGSLRMPASATGLFGLKPQRGRVSPAPYDEVWTGLSVAGPLTRTVSDSALLLDVLHGPAPGDRHIARPPDRTFAEAAASGPGRLRVGLSLRPWPVGGRLDPRVEDAVRGMADAIAELGHEVVRVEPPLTDRTGMLSYGPRYLHSIASSAAVLDEPRRLSSSTRRLAALGRLHPPAVIAAARRYSDRVAARANRVFDTVDVLLTPVTPRPPLRVGELYERGWLTTLLGAQRYTAFVTLWNLAGNPAAVVPAARTHDGLPLGAQLVGRPHDESTLLALSAQLEAEHPWSRPRPQLD